MICPVCKVDMMVVEYGGIELDHCLNCKGVWFDAGELDLLMKTAGMEGALSIPAEEADVQEKKRKCPICARPMRKTHIGAEPRVLIDVCYQGDGIWFDGGELGEVVRQIAAVEGKRDDAQEKVLRFVGDVFKAE